MYNLTQVMVAAIRSPRHHYYVAYTDGRVGLVNFKLVAGKIHVRLPQMLAS